MFQQWTASAMNKFYKNKTALFKTSVFFKEEAQKK